MHAQADKLKRQVEILEANQGMAILHPGNKISCGKQTGGASCSKGERGQAKSLSIVLVRFGLGCFA